MLNEVQSRVRDISRLVLAVLLLGLAVPAVARAQLVAAATVESQYRLRGVSLTDNEPDVRLSLSDDFASGAYAGASIIGGETVRDGVQALGYVAYAGFAKQMANGLGWDVGATNSDIVLYLPVQRGIGSAQNTPGAPGYNPNATQAGTHRYTIDYSELYAGVSLPDLSARLYVSPDYLGQNLRTAYLDVTASIRPVSQLRLYAHLGGLTPLGGSAGPNSDRQRGDLGAGAAWEFRRSEVQLGWTATTPQLEYPVGYRQARDALIVSLTAFF